MKYQKVTRGRCNWWNLTRVNNRLEYGFCDRFGWFRRRFSDTFNLHMSLGCAALRQILQSDFGSSYPIELKYCISIKLQWQYSIMVIKSWSDEDNGAPIYNYNTIMLKSCIPIICSDDSTLWWWQVWVHFNKLTVLYHHHH